MYKLLILDDLAGRGPLKSSGSGAINGNTQAPEGRHFAQEGMAEVIALSSTLQHLEREPGTNP